MCGADRVASDDETARRASQSHGLRWQESNAQRRGRGRNPAQDAANGPWAGQATEDCRLAGWDGHVWILGPSTSTRRRPRLIVDWIFSTRWRSRPRRLLAATMTTRWRSRIWMEGHVELRKREPEFLISTLGTACWRSRPRDFIRSHCRLPALYALWLRAPASGL